MPADFGGGDGKGAGDVQGVLGAEEGDFEDQVGLGEGFVGDAVLFVAEDEGEGGGKEVVGQREGVVAGVEGDEGAGEVGEGSSLETGDEGGCAHGGAGHFFVVEVGGFVGEVDGSNAEGFGGAEDAADVIGGADVVEVDGNGEIVVCGGMVAGAKAGEKIVLFETPAGFCEMPVIAVGDFFEIGGVKGMEFHPGGPLFITGPFGGGLAAEERFVEGAEEIGAEFVAVARFEEEKFSFCEGMHYFCRFSR